MLEYTDGFIYFCSIVATAGQLPKLEGETWQEEQFSSCLFEESWWEFGDEGPNTFKNHRILMMEELCANT